ncbi:FK506-binding protein 15 [Papilio xuthus]|uniref:FK506-binding protein 15 n=1 Tax=Papilio xuthus TaxID=66420 RepID=A0A194PQ59_PAPXU|nr:FK506-binding protein 15 [Papilio xuthus]
MLEAEEVDVDFFTPVSSTSLSKIFNTDKHEDKENASLIYVPQPIQNDAQQKNEESKASQIVYAGVFYAYEWSNNAYVSKGKTGAAIIKNQKTEQCNIILYDSNKVTLSCTNISSQLKVVIKENANLSFYDNTGKYWSLYGTEAEISKCIENLKLLGVTMENSNEDSKSKPQIMKCEENNILTQNPTDHKESDTDSSINRRTKDSILKRMATMGHSVLPIQSTNYTKSNSSDSDESAEKVIRHKPQRSTTKTKTSEKIDCTDSCTEINWKKTSPILQNQENITVTSYDHRIVPISSSNIMNNPILNNSNELNLFMSEQRISNSEIRINMNRMTDKLDKILDNIQGVCNQGSNNNIGYENSIVQKLLAEYENKIKLYEDFIMSKGLDCSILKSSQKQENDDLNVYKNKITGLQNIIEKQEEENSRLSNELKSLEEKYKRLCKEREEEDDIKTKEVTFLRNELNMRNEEFKTQAEQMENNIQRNKDDFKNKLKSIMNRTFHALSANFDVNESYTGPDVKSLLASVIKKETIGALNDV